MKIKEKVLEEEIFQSPLLVKLSQMASDHAGVRLIVVFPKDDGWAQACLGDASGKPSFCSRIQGTKDGSKQCKMCHVLLTVAACGAGPTLQRCHAGVSVLVNPVSETKDDAVAVLSTCAFAEGIRDAAWEEARERVKKLGVDLKTFEEDYHGLPELTEDKIKIARDIMDVTAEAVSEIIERHKLQRKVGVLSSRKDKSVKTVIQSAIEHEIKNVGRNSAPDMKDWQGGGKKMPVLVKVVERLVSHKPDMPYSVGDIAAAARITPNHFSALFHQYKGVTFMDYVTVKRIDMAKKLLADLTLTISEVASGVGYDDPGYFARRFRQKTGSSPREWRERIL